MGIFTPITNELDLILAIGGLFVIGFVLDYIVLPITDYITGRRSEGSQQSREASKRRVKAGHSLSVHH
jgi:hypothetical protein